MFDVTRILAPVVFSENCRGALRYAAALASRFEAELVVTHVLEPLTPLGFEPPSGPEYIDRCRRDWVIRELERLVFAPARQMRVETVCLEGEASREIVRYAEAHHVDLIVIAAHGHGPVRRFLLGSVTAKVLHDARCAVLTGAHMERALVDAAEPVAFHIIACAVDLEPQAETALAWAQHLAMAYDAKLVLAHTAAHAAAAAGASSAETAWRAMPELAGIGAKSRPLSGNIAAEVCRFAKEAGADLLVIPRGHHEGGRLRSTSYTIMRESPCPVLSA